MKQQQLQQQQQPPHKKQQQQPPPQHQQQRKQIILPYISAVKKQNFHHVNSSTNSIATVKATNNAYIGKTTRKAQSRMAEHKGHVRGGGRDKSGIAAHKENCPNGDINFDNLTIIATVNARSKRQADFKLDYMESLMIKLHKTGPGNGFNEDEGRMADASLPSNGILY